MGCVVIQQQDFDLDDFVDWFTPDRIKQVVVVAFVIGILTAIVTMAAHRDEHSIKMSGKWVTDQLLKYAPDKKSDRP